VTAFRADDSACGVSAPGNCASGKCGRCGDEHSAIAAGRGVGIPTPPAMDSRPPESFSAVRLADPPRVLFWGAVLLAALVCLALTIDPTLPVMAIVLTGWLLFRRLTRAKSRSVDGRLPSYPSSGQVIGGFLASLEHVVTGQQRPVAQIHVQYHESWDSVGDVTVLGLDERIERPAHPDRSRARL